MIAAGRRLGRIAELDGVLQVQHGVVELIVLLVHLEPGGVRGVLRFVLHRRQSARTLSDAGGAGRADRASE
jgi:hypothetical protein